MTATARGGPLRIIHTESSLGWGGQEIRILGEAAGLRRRGHDVRVYAARDSRIAEEAARFGVPLDVLPIGRKGPAGLAAMTRSLARDLPDVVNTHSSTDSWLAALACPLLSTRAPVLVRTRHVSVPVQNDRATRWLYRKAMALTVTTGEALRDALVRNIGLDPARVESVPTGIDAARYAGPSKRDARAALGLPAEAPLVGIVATLRSWKGHRYLVGALPLLARRDARLIIVGDGPQREALESQVGQAGLRDRVIFTGQQNDVAPWLAAMDVFALPSYANEGVPQALLQAMFARVPAVTTDAGGIPEIARHGDTATIVAKEDAASLAAGIDALLGDRARATAQAERAHASVAGRYTEAAMLDRMEAVFRKALASAENSFPARPT